MYKEFLRILGDLSKQRNLQYEEKSIDNNVQEIHIQSKICKMTMQKQSEQDILNLFFDYTEDAKRKFGFAFASELGEPDVEVYRCGNGWLSGLSWYNSQELSENLCDMIKYGPGVKPEDYETLFGKADNS